MSYRIYILAVTGLAFSVAACGSYGTSVIEGNAPPAHVASVSLTVPNSLTAGQTARAVAIPKDASGIPLRDRRVTWFTSSATIASVSDSGMISAVAPGSAVVSAVSEGVSGQATMAVLPPTPTPIATLSVAVNPSSLVIGQTANATVTLRDSTGAQIFGRPITWASSNSSIAVVASTGVVTAVAAGTAMISASSEGKSASSALSISAPAPVPVASVAVSPGTATLQVGATTQLSAVTRDANNNVLSGRSVTWNSNNTAISTVSGSGLVSAVAAGSATITASSEGKSGSGAITVTGAPPPAGSPATVTDLSVFAIDSTGVTLSFTQVNDGTGQPAKYDVRYALSPISWGSATSTTSGTCTTPIAGTAIGSQLTCTVLGLTPLTNYSFQLIAFRGTLNVDAVFSSLSNIVSATTTGAPPPPPPLPPPGGSAEPAGMTLLSDRPFSAVDEGWGSAWDEGGGGGPGNFSIVSDATAPRSPSSVGQMRFPVGLVGGYPPAVVGTSFPGTSRTLYVAMWVKLSTNWLGNTGSGGAKITHIWINGVNRIYTYVDGVSGTLSPWVNLQQLAGGGFDARPQGGQGSGGSVNLPPNVAGQTGVQIVRGQWYKWELVTYGGTPGNADGTVDWWINGVKVGHYTGIPFVAAGGSNTWEMIEWNPTWGGLGGTISAAQYQWMDHVYISGKP